MQTKETPSIDNNLYLLEELKNKLIQLNYQADIHSPYSVLIVDYGIEIRTAIVDNPNYHPSLLHLKSFTIHPKYFANGIQENIVGLGTTLQDKVNVAIDNYLSTILLPIIDWLSNKKCYSDFDFSTEINGTEVLWHTKIGKLTVQGQWEQQPEWEVLFNIVKDKLKDKLTSSKINWLKLYISKQADGEIIGECLLNNEPLEEGLAGIAEYAKSWTMKGFQGLKQFIIFRQCDKNDKNGLR